MQRKPNKTLHAQSTFRVIVIEGIHLQTAN